MIRHNTSFPRAKLELQMTCLSPSKIRPEAIADQLFSQASPGGAGVRSPLTDTKEALPVWGDLLQ